MKVLVTGGGGFLGRHIVEKLLARGDAVAILGRREQPDLAARGVRGFSCSIEDASAVQAACKGQDAVIHVAAKAGIWGPRAAYFAANVTGTRNVIAACRTEGVARLVYTSTPSVVYGTGEIDGGNESLPYPDRYLTAYAETKALAEREVLAASGASLLTCGLRPHIIWGPGDTNLIPRLVARAKSGRLARVGNGQNRISVSYVENVADAHLAALDRLTPGSPVCGKVYFVNETEPVACWDFIASLLAALGCPAVKRAVPLKAAYALGWMMEKTFGLLGLQSEPPMTRFLALQLGTSHWFRTARAEQDLGWTPRVTIDEGIRRLTASYTETDAART